MSAIYNKQMVDCGCCHFTKYANRDSEIKLDCTIGEYIDATWPHCPCGKKNCSTYQVFLSTSHRIADIPVKRYFCPCTNPNYYHLEWKDQRSYHRLSRKSKESRRQRSRSRSPSRSIQRTDKIQKVDITQSKDESIPIQEKEEGQILDFRDHLISQLQQQILILQRELQLRDFYIQQTSLPFNQ